MEDFNQLVNHNIETVYNAIVKSGKHNITFSQMAPLIQKIDGNVVRKCLYRLKARGLITYGDAMMWISITDKPFHQEKKTERLYIRVTESQKKLIEQISKDEGISVSDLLIKPFLELSK